ncbi:MAG: pantoate--beta-alanine ligase [Planctomycetota bacterium]|jgi:pantoate--beta-alanine ligase
MEVAKTIESVRSLVKSARGAGKTIGLVPTMGALHVGHLSLIERAVKETDFVVVSIFVNPTQFGPEEDLEKYPQTFEADCKMCEKAGVDLIFAPSPEQMYGQQCFTWVNVEKLTGTLCGQFRPGHFLGVTTVCAKLFNIVLPDIAFFGQKDAQQTVVIQRMVADLNMPLEIVVCPTVREANGLALSSRNKYLSDQQRQHAAYIYQSLQKSSQLIENRARDAADIIAQMRVIIEQAEEIEVEYISIVDSQTLQNLEFVGGRVLVAVAARLGSARLIDNIVVDVPG